MAVLKMQRLTVCALKKDRKAILEKLQSMGVLQVDPVSGDDRDFRKMPVTVLQERLWQGRF